MGKAGPARHLLLCASLAAGCFAVTAPQAHATVLNVTESTDELNADGDCSLREAIHAANTNTMVDQCPAGESTGSDLILLQGRRRYTLSRTSGPANTFGSLDIYSDMYISGGGNNTIIDANDIDRVINITGGMDVDVNLNFLWVGGGHITGGYGAGISNQGDLRLSHVLVSGNTVMGNTGADYGAGITTPTGFRARITGSEVAFNESHLAAGVSNGGTTIIKNSLIWFNTAGETGGGFENVGTAVLTNVTISDNLANSGGGIMNRPGGTVTVRHATIYDNRASPGFPANVDNFGTSISFSNTLVGKPSSGINCAGSITSSGHNLSSDATCNFNRASDLENRNPRVRDLGGNGGFASTHALRASSPAVNAGAGNLARDQRGVPRPQGRRPDIGAYERASCGGRLVNTVGSPFSDLLAGTGVDDGLIGLGRADTLNGKPGADGLCGGSGADTLLGKAGRDKLLGSRGDDELNGGAGIDVCKGGPGTDSATRCERTTGVP